MKFSEPVSREKLEILFRNSFSISDLFFSSSFSFISSVDDFLEAQKQSLIFISNSSLFPPDWFEGIVVTNGSTLESWKSYKGSWVLVEDVRYAMAQFLNICKDKFFYSNKVVSDEAVVSDGVFIGQHTIIEKGVVLEPNCTILNRCHIKENTVIQSGVVVGADGFGFAEKDKKFYQIPHLAGVEICTNVFVGANTVIAAGVLKPTRLGDNTKLDSHIQIGHSVQVGKSARISSQSGVGGSTKIGDFFLAGGGVSISDHLTIGDNVTVAALSGVTKNISSKQVIAGFPAMPIYEWKKKEAWLRRESKR